MPSLKPAIFSAEIELTANCGALSNNQAIELMQRAREFYGDDWFIHNKPCFGGKFFVYATHTQTHVALKLTPEKAINKIIHSRKLTTKFTKRTTKKNSI